MTSPVEERLRRALTQHAGTTTTTPDAWPGIRARMDWRRGTHRPGFLRWAILAPAATVVVVAVVLLASLVGGDGDGSIRVAGTAGRLYLAPTGVDGRFRLTAADTDPQSSPQPPGLFRAFGRRARDGIALDASAVVTLPSDFALIGADPAPFPQRVLGRDVAVSSDHYGRTILNWAQKDGQTVGVMTFGLSDSELVVLAESLILGDAASDAPALPPGFMPVHSGALPGGVLSVSVQSWEADDGAGFTVSVADLPGVTIDDLAWYLPGGRATQVRGVTGIYWDRGDAELMWIERPGVVVSVHGTGLPEKDLFAIAQGLRPVDEPAWRQLRAGVQQPAGSPPSRILEPLGVAKVLTPANSFFVIAPVDGQSLPPCRPDPSAPSVLVVAQAVGGQEVACLRLGPAHLAADDVSTATARPDRASGSWQVEFTLTSDGAARFNALFHAVGTGGQVAILVDGGLVSAPRVASPSAPAKGLVTGLDEQTARHLADRLRP